MIFNQFLKESEFKVVLTIACVINCIGAFLTMLFCLSFTFGIPDFLFVLLTSTVTDTLHICYITLPVLVLFAKLIPEKIEASLFAFLMGLCNLSSYFVATNLGNLFNLWIKDTTETLEENTWKLYAIQAACALLPLFFMGLVPTRVQVQNVQKCYEFIQLYEGKSRSAEMEKDFSELNPDTALRLGVKHPNQIPVV